MVLVRLSSAVILPDLAEILNTYVLLNAVDNSEKILNLYKQCGFLLTLIAGYCIKTWLSFDYRIVIFSR